MSVDLSADQEITEALIALRERAPGARRADWFQREIEIAARLSHPHILPLYDSGGADGLLYYITRPRPRSTSSKQTAPTSTRSPRTEPHTRPGRPTEQRSRSPAAGTSSS